MEEIVNMKQRFCLAAFTALALITSCVKANPEPDDPHTPPAEESLGNRPLVKHTFEPGSLTVKSVTFDSGKDAWLNLEWDNAIDEKISVYIQNPSGTYYYAGDIISPACNDARRLFSGNIIAKEEGEKYMYVHPSLASQEVSGEEAKGSIDLSSQAGTVEGLKDILPFVWKEKSDGQGIDQVKTAYLIKLTMQFATDPGAVSSVTMETMDKTSADNVFPSRFTAASGFTASADSKSITLSNGGNSGTTRVLYLLSSSDPSKNVYESKFRFIATDSNSNKYYSEFRSFPGQDSEQASQSKTLTAFENGKTFRASRKMSSVPPPTVINSTYKVNSLLGMWNEFGKPYDPDRRIISAENLNSAEVPGNLKALIGTTQLQADFDRRMLKHFYTSNNVNTPTFLGELYHKKNNNGGKTINLKKASKVFVTFVSEYAWDRNLLGYYSYTGSHPSTETVLTKNIVFADMSRPGHIPFVDENHAYKTGNALDAPLKPYSTVQLYYVDDDGFSHEEFPKDTYIGFFVMKNTIVTDGNSILNWTSSRLFTNYGLNSANPEMNYFASGDIIKPSTTVTTYDGSSDKLKGVAIFGCKDDLNSDNYRFAAMSFIVSTSDPDALSINNTAAFNVGVLDNEDNPSNLVVGSQADINISMSLSKGIVSTDESTEWTFNSKYETTLRIDDDLYGGFLTVSVKHGSEDVTPVIEGNTCKIQIDQVSSNITITASTVNTVKVKALTAEEVNALNTPYETSGKSDYKLVLHCLSSNQNDGAFTIDASGNRLVLPGSESPIWNKHNAIVSAQDASMELDPMGRYNDYFLTAKKTDGGIKLKTASEQFICRSADPADLYRNYYPTVKASGSAQENDSVFTAIQYGSDAYAMKLKLSSLQQGNIFMSFRFGGSDSTPIFSADGNHINSYGVWRVYKVWAEPK